MASLNEEVRRILNEVKRAPDFCYVEFDSINATNAFGDNALHCLCVSGDLESVKVLVENGININQPGENGYSPLDEAESFEHEEIVAYLNEKGAKNGNIDMDNLDREAWDKHMSKLNESIESLRRRLT